MADSDLELRGGGGEGGFDFLALLPFFPSVISSFFPQHKRGEGGCDSYIIYIGLFQCNGG